MSNKILNKITHLIKNNLESDWEEDLVNLNIWDEVCDLYYKFDQDGRKANIIFAYIVLAYSKHSGRIDMHMNRMENKRKILMSLAGPSAMADDDYCKAAVGHLSPYTEIIEFYVNYQKDRRFQEIVASYDYHAKATAMMNNATDTKEMETAGRVFKIACEMRQNADAMIKVIESENVVLDSALAAEERTKLSDRRGEDYMSHEIYMKGLKNSDDEIDFSSDDILNSYEGGPLN